ncbi:hypothetical protein [Bacillus massiliigorillae]|uniref:hypothetical protein n=1 Tax=Bacillus massiliigorillae TaxID=1243664 RepID=UPI0003A75CC5|nr:hypothetical protein [Bacillus massiliigorillae]
MKKQVPEQTSTTDSSSNLQIEELENALNKMVDAEFKNLEKKEQKIKMIYIRTLVNLERINESIIMPFRFGSLTLSPFSKPLTAKEWGDIWKNCKVNVQYEVRFKPLTNNLTNKLIHAE